MGLRRYQTHGFYPISNPPARRQALAATVTIVKGDMLCDNGSGYMTNADTAFAATHMGVAAADVVGDSSTKYVEYWPLDPRTQYIVPVSTSLIERGDVGAVVNIGSNDDLDVDTTVTTGIGFRIDDLDVSAAAIAANTYGYAIGHFELGLAAQT